MEELKGLIFDIQSFSVHDGPGIRTSIFLCGCPLRCEWCANPEGLELREKLLFSSQKCKHKKIGCTRCINACPHGAISVKKDEKRSLEFNRYLCNNCTTFDCVKVCYHEAARISGKWMTISELTKKIERDRNFWNNGGVTFTGGEPFFQQKFLLEALKKFKEGHIHTAIETTACIDTETFLKTMQYIDFAFIDIKHMNPAKHKEKAGVSNSLILENIAKLSLSDWKGRLILRIPIIEEYNDTKENIESVVGFMIKNDLFEINILPFHRLGDSKWTQLGMSYKYKDKLPTTKEKLLEIQNMFLDNRIACYVGEEILY